MKKNLTTQNYNQIFLDSHPGFFDKGELDRCTEGDKYEEMFLDLSEFTYDEAATPVGDNVTFGYYEGDRDTLLEAVKEMGYDYSYIHYTGVANWYAKLGYRTEIIWNKHGIIEA